ncbi:MAG: tetratricopeptide repeat protein [Verrucomicrobiia bacterium]
MRIVSFWKWRGCLPAAGLAAAVIACTAEAQTANPSPQVVAEMNRGVSLMGQYQYSEAAKAFEQVVKQAPNLLEARINLAIALFNRNGQEDLAAAEKVLKEVLAKEPGNIRALYFQAIVLQHVGKAEEAIPNLQAVLKQRPDDGAAWYLFALCKQRVGQPAEGEFLKAIEFRPYLFSAYYQLYQASMRAAGRRRRSSMWSVSRPFAKARLANRWSSRNTTRWAIWRWRSRFRPTASRLCRRANINSERVRLPSRGRGARRLVPLAAAGLAAQRWAT